jgi:hypothetical protein
MNKKTIAPLIALFVLIFTSCTTRTEKKEPVLLQTSASLVEMSLEDLIVDSELIVIGKITTTFPSYWIHQNEKDVQEATLEELVAAKGLFTDSSLEIAQIIKGTSEDTTIRLRTFIGKTAEIQVYNSSEPEYQEGQVYLLFLEKDTGPTQIVEPGDYIANGAIQGVCEIIDSKAVSCCGEEWEINELIAHIRQTLRSFFGPHLDNPLGNGELVSLDEAQARLSFFIPLPDGFAVKEVWVSPEEVASDNRAVAIQFENDLVLIIHQLANEPNWDGTGSSAPELAKISVNGHNGLGANPGIKFVAGKEYPYPGSVAWWMNGLDITLYSDTLHLEELLKIAETVH